MNKSEEENLLKQLSRNERHVVENFPDYARGKILEKIASGYRISQVNYYEIEVVKGFTYYNIERGGRMYQV